MFHAKFYKFRVASPSSSSSSVGATTLGGIWPALRFRSTIFYLYTSLSSFSSWLTGINSDPQVRSFLLRGIEFVSGLTVPRFSPDPRLHTLRLDLIPSNTEK